MRKLKTAIVGTGFMGKVHSENVRRLGNVEIAAVAGSSAERAKSFADSSGVDHSTRDWHTLLTEKSLDAVHILTPNALHCQQSVAFLEAGKAVLCEKPMTLDEAEGKQMVDAAAKTG